MLVCPHCREVNPEGTGTCKECGKELKPTRQLIASRRAEVPELEITPPKQGKAWPRVLVLFLIATGIAAAAVWLAVRPSPCDGKFSSSQFGYCLEVPAGWSSSVAKIGDAPVDQFMRQPAVAFVMSIDLLPGTTLDTYARIARRQDRDAGLAVGASRETTIAGSPALEWDLTQPDGGEFRGVQLVTVEGETGWTVQLNDYVDSFDSSVEPFRSMLSSWHFR